MRKRSSSYDRFGQMKFSIKTTLRLTAMRTVDEKILQRMLADINTAFRSPGR